MNASCPCRALEDDQVSFEDCCKPFLMGSQKAPTAEKLMRSRYSAYVKNMIDYVAETQIAIEGDEFDHEAASQWALNSDWLGLEVKKVSQGEVEDDKGVVEFKAHYKDKKNGKSFIHHESSTFVKNNNQWMFYGGEILGPKTLVRSSPKVGRNDPCPCNSGKKFKKCCG